MSQQIYYSFHDIPFEGGNQYALGKSPRLRFSTRELIDLIISIVALSIAFSIAISVQSHGADFVNEIINIFPYSILAVITAFACHETAHKYMGIRYGYWSEYRMFPLGLSLAVLISFTGFLFAAPGAVQIFGTPNRSENGIISAAGPATNLGIAIFFTGISTIMTINGDLFSWIAYINAALGFFNLLPIGPLDGKKIMQWNTGLWALLIVISLSLIILV